MKLRFLVLLFLAGTVLSFGQKAKGDNLFFAYAYNDAIHAYKKEQMEKPLTNQQQINLAESYLKVGDVKNATKVYLEAFKEEDGKMTNHQFNYMLQCISKTFGTERVEAFLATRKGLLPKELIDNADFNLKLLKTDINTDLDYKVFNLESNSRHADFSPAFYDGRLLFTTGRAQSFKNVPSPSGKPYLDIYIAKIMNNGKVISPTAFSGIPDSNFHEATPYYSKELKEIFFVRSNVEDGALVFSEKGKNSLVIGKVDEDGGFTFLLRDPNTSFFYPFYEAETSKLYFVANFEGGYGGTDIYYVHTNNGQIMSSPVNLGPSINSPGNEIAPYIFDNSLYFSSDVFYGLGGMDIYKTNMQPNDSFSIPINLGKGINSSTDDFGFIMQENTTGGLTGYFSSNREGGKGEDDIYGFSVKEKPGLKTLVFRGKITNPDTSLPISKVAVQVLDLDKKLIGETVTGQEGTYQIEIPWRENVVLKATKNRFSQFSVTYDKNSLEEVVTSDINFSMVLLNDLVREREKQTVIKLNKFYFGRGKSVITTGIAMELDKVVYALKQFPQLQLRIESHTDSRGGGASNFRLSQRRSDVIKKYLVKKGVSISSILYSIGYGEDKILNNCTNGVYCLEMLHKKNDRTLIVVLNYDLLFD
ncbi:MAG: OmpA family protein [Cellulophaga sp.]